MNEEFKSSMTPLMEKTRRILKRHAELMRTNPMYALAHTFEMGWIVTEVALVKEGYTPSKIEAFKRIAWKKFIRDHEEELKQLDNLKSEAE